MSTETKSAPASLGFDDAFEGMDINAWTPDKPKNDLKPKPDTKQVKKVAEKIGFTSREPAPAKEPEGQINIRAKQRVLDDFRALSDSQTPVSWPLGYTLERALAALKRELTSEG